ncbi:hypothetical protein ISF_06188 [Cordyceps fumosorosea ARSEF 2679]|uniref:Uncharacterized protein n=1 Tax=Cordyceps fumosorosea (strain ARSEF 2679) TaxID=1081104 RepID=A0A167S4Y7_CORFA|nr:hypothetical protein ISF_06188 [Cordyceps fumosorosea ARSEF 2679]OAA59253.1 hypothetical protein ISF_06188 [Cordyceps fumosorosea ARSEF 2679]
MHVCREARYAVQDRVRFRASHAAGCPTPFRCFWPELDVVYLGSQGIYLMHLFVWPDSRVFDSSSLEPSRERDELLRRLLQTLLRTRPFAAAAVPGHAVMIKEVFSAVVGGPAAAAGPGLGCVMWCRRPRS